MEIITPFNYSLLYPWPVEYYNLVVFIIFYGGLKIAKLSLRKILIFCIGLFFTSSFFFSGLQSDLFTNPLSFYFGLPFFILFVFFIISYLGRDRNLDIIYLAILFIYFTATKAILGIIIPFVLVIIVGYFGASNIFYRIIL